MIQTVLLQEGLGNRLLCHYLLSFCLNQVSGLSDFHFNLENETLSPDCRKMGESEGEKQ